MIFPMTADVHGHYMPYLTIMLRHGERRVRRQFLIDSGAARSLAPRSVAARLIDDAYDRPLQDLPLKGATGQPLRGFSLEVQIEVPRLGVVDDVIWFCPDLRFELLGQRHWFERVGVKFENFVAATTERRFCLHHAWHR